MEPLAQFTDNIRYISPVALYDAVFGFIGRAARVVQEALESGTPLYAAHALSILFAVGIVYCLIRVFLIYREWHRRYGVEAAEIPEEPVPGNARWEQVLALRDSQNPSDWKLAVLEADAMLEAMVERLGYPGDNLGERLKAIEPSDFPFLQDAWDAHKVRNRIAHEGAGADLSRHEMLRVLGLYENIFRDSHYI